MLDLQKVQHSVSPDHRPPNRRRLVTQITEGNEWTGVTDAPRGPTGCRALAEATTGATGSQTGRPDVTATPSSSPGPASLPPSWQLRKTVLLNNGNQCYLNSLALAILHTCIQDHVWQGMAGDFAPALQAILASHRPRSLRNLYAWQMALRGWLRPTLQHDVCELYYFLRTRFNMPGFAGTWEARAIIGPSWTTAVAASSGIPSPPQFPLPSNDLPPVRNSSTSGIVERSACRL